MNLRIVLVITAFYFPFLLHAQPLTAQVEDLGDVSCFGLNDGYITIDASGGTGPYSYELNGSGQALPNRTINQLPPGVHTVTIRDVSFNSFDLTFTIDEPMPLSLGMAQIQNVICYGDNTGEVSLVANGGSGTYEFAVNQNAFSSSPNFKFLAAGAYQFRVRDQNQCEDDSLIFLSSNQQIQTISFEKTDVSCFGSQDGRLELRSFGGTGDFQYSLDSTTFFTQNLLTDLGPGSYTITTLDSSGCQVQDIFNIEEPDSLQFSFEKEDVSCHGVGDGRISISASGGLAPYFYSIQDTNFSFAPEVNQLNPGMYFLKVMDIRGCLSRTDTISITEPELLQASITATELSCKGDQDARADLTVTGGLMPYTISWNDNQNLNANSLDNLGSGLHYAVVEDANGCSETTFINIIEPDSTIRIDLIELESSFCSLDNGMAKVKISHGTGLLAYNWSHDPSLQISTANSLTPGTYALQVTDEKACSASIEFDITSGGNVIAAFESFPDLDSRHVAAQGELRLLNRSKGAENYQWDFGDGQGVSNLANPIYTFTEAGTYDITLVASDAQGLCVDSFVQSITIQEDEWVQVPDAFSPNGDGVNDNFIAVGSGVERFEMSFFNRWGEKVHEQSSIADSWDGRDEKGKIVRPGMYAYKMRVVFLSGFVLERAGGFMILR